MRAWWRFHFKEAKQIHAARESCKYVVKPTELEKLTAAELVQLHHELFRLHLVQCLGELKELRKRLEDTRVRLVKRQNEERPYWEMVEDWNRYGSKKSESDSVHHDSDIEDWLVCTLPPSFALSEKAEPLALVLDYRGTRLQENKRLQTVREACELAYADERGIE